MTKLEEAAVEFIAKLCEHCARPCEGRDNGKCYCPRIEGPYQGRVCVSLQRLRARTAIMELDDGTVQETSDS